MTGVVQDLRFAIRGLAKSPGFTAMAILTLALAIGANTAVFSVVNAVYLKKLPITDPERFVQISGEPWFATSVWECIRDHQPIFDRVTAAGIDRFNLARGGIAQYATSLVVGGDFFGTVGVAPALGRAITSVDDTIGAQPVAMVSHGFWQRELAGKPDVIGNVLWVEGQPFEIVGVAPRAFVGLEVGRSVDIIVPMASLATIPSRSLFLNPTAVWLQIFARLRPGQTLEQATAALGAWQPTLADATRPALGTPGRAPDQHLVQPLDVRSSATGTSEVRAHFGDAMLYLFGVTGIVLLIACVNLAAFVLARFIDRHHELGMRRALGASRWDVARALVTENVILVAAGAVLGGVIASTSVAYVVPYLTAPDFRYLPAYLDVTPDWRVFGVITLLALIGAFVSGVIPAIRAYQLSPLAGFSTVSRTATSSPGATRSVRALLVGQVAFSLVLLAGAALLVRSFVGLITQDIGFDHERVMVVTVAGDLGQDRSAQFQAIDEIRRRLELLHNVDAVSASLVTPISGQRAMIFLSVPGFTALESSDSRPLANRVSSSHFRVYGTPLLTGRDFDERDSLDSPAVAIVNRAFAERYFNGQDPVGRTIVLNKRDATIIGMAANAKQLTLRDPARPFVYAPMSQWGVTDLATVRFGVRTSNGAPTHAAIAAAVRQLNPAWTLEIRALADDVRRSLNVERLLAWCGGAFALLAVAIGVIGTYGMFAYGVSRRRQEIGVRIALGATPGRISRLVMDDAIVIMTAGVLLGLGGTWLVGGIVERFLFQISSHDPVTLAAATVTMMGAAAMASAVPARRAARVDPIVALRYE